MSELLAFAWLGFRHIVDVSAGDHILFLLALAVIYRGSDWRDALWVISAFTVGHSITLALAASNVIQPSRPIVEFLIPLTILATAIENIAVRDHRQSRWRHYRPLFAGLFGLIHGAGFAGYLKSVFMDRIAVPLLGFNIGVELGQIVVLLAIALALALFDAALRKAQAHAQRPTLFRVRAVGLSALIALIATGWAVQRQPW
ncbi:MAG: HupE/UreJ family protein [Gemmatimonas sp.]